jgi:hypothetical protein
MLKRRKVFLVGAIDDKLAKATCIQVVTFHPPRLDTNYRGAHAHGAQTHTRPKRAGPARATRALRPPSGTPPRRRACSEGRAFRPQALFLALAPPSPADFHPPIARSARRSSSSRRRRPACPSTCTSTAPAERSARRQARRRRAPEGARTASPALAGSVVGPIPARLDRRLAGSVMNWIGYGLDQ